MERSCTGTSVTAIAFAFFKKKMLIYNAVKLVVVLILRYI